jgi:exopolyphosphatase/guanosine-5'-triphosphate,3'-diphosphate pyrophosphatase
MPTFAAIDIGSNSCRLKIASTVQHRLKTLHEDREVTRLGESVFETGVISPDAMANTIKALKRFHKAVQLHVADKVRVVATSAMRDARNATAFTEWVRSATGWQIEVISGLEEGRLIHLGVVTREPGAMGKCLLIDLGGGSCEVTLSDAGRVKQMISLPLGAVRLQQEFLRHDPPLKEDVARLQQFIERELKRGEKKLGKLQVPLVIATSGTAAALAEATVALQARLLAAPKPDARSSRAGDKASARTGVASMPAKFVRVQPTEASTADIRKLADRLVKMTNAERAAVPGIGPRRSEIIIGGAQVYARLLERFCLKGFRYSALGLRDGMLAQMLAEVDLRAAVHQKLEDERWNGVLEVCRRYGINEKQAQAVRAHAAQLFDDLKEVHQLPAEYRGWLEAAAMMQEVGKFISHQGHHRHTQYIIANSDRASAVVGLKTVVYPKRVTIEITPGRGGAELECWAIKKEAGYFLEILRRELTVDVL